MASFGYQLAIRHGVPHGLANAIMIDKTMAI
jgi:alcohol dehydrogenase class IV